MQVCRRLVKKLRGAPARYARSFFGIVDLVAVLPTYLAVFVPELHALIDVRLLRMLRIFRILKLASYFSEYQLLGAAHEIHTRPAKRPAAAPSRR